MLLCECIWVGIERKPHNVKRLHVLKECLILVDLLRLDRCCVIKPHNDVLASIFCNNLVVVFQKLSTCLVDAFDAAIRGIKLLSLDQPRFLFQREHFLVAETGMYDLEVLKVGTPEADIEVFFDRAHPVDVRENVDE